MKNKLPPVLIDLDGVVFDFVDSYYRVAKAKYPELYAMLPKQEDIKTFYIEDSIVGVNDELRAMAWDLVSASEQLFDPNHMKVYEGAVSGILQLMRRYEVFFVTTPHNANKFCMNQKVEGIDSLFGRDASKRIILSHDKTLIDGVVLIDDKPEPNGSWNPRWEHVVFDHPYNREVTGKYRMMNWSQQSVQQLMAYIDAQYKCMRVLYAPQEEF